MPPKDSTFDYIVVGAGSAGCVLANRLSADRRRSVLLIEAGGDDRPFANRAQFVANTLIHVPVGFAANMFNPRLTWGYQSEPEPDAGGRRFDTIRGRVLGGSSAINAMLYVRGEREDYARWRKAGCTGWDWDDVLPYFRRAEHQECGEDAWHGVGGPLHVTETAPYPVMEKVLEAANAMGFPRAESFNRGVQFGGGPAQLTIRRGKRHSTASAYLNPARSRPNLYIATETLVTKVLIESRRAVGVAVLRGGEAGAYRARGQVILAGGAINSPQLLELSGVGSGARLSRLDVPIVADSPGVGENLQDHYYAPMSWRLRPGVRSINALTRFPAIGLEAIKYLALRRGLLAQSAVQLFVYAKSSPDMPTADLQLSFTPASMRRREAGDEVMKSEFHGGMTMSSCPLRPASRGHVHIKSRDAADAPAIRFGYLSDLRDMHAQIAGLRLGRALGSHPTLASHLETEDFPGVDAASDEALAGHVRATGGTVYHPVGTVRMGGDAAAPLDPRLRVRGVEGLRVVDASIMPFLVSGNTNAPTVMIAEMAADMILKDTP